MSMKRTRGRLAFAHPSVKVLRSEENLEIVNARLGDETAWSNTVLC